jgi:hypothetical protein
MANRRKLIEELRLAINQNCQSELTFQQVDFYIGDYMQLESIQLWIEETKYSKNPVTASMVIDHWNNGFIFEA